MWKGAALFLLASLAVGWHFRYLFEPSEPPKLPYQYWGPGQPKPDSKDVTPFKINVPKEVLDDLNRRLDGWRESAPGLEGAAWTYGVPRDSVRKIRDYWRHKYNWAQRQTLLNKYPQFTTEVQGLKIHFYRVKPEVPKGSKVKVLPLLLVHGWPGSVVEFQKVIPLLTTPQPGSKHVFEVIAPSLPGYGFSDGAVRPGLGPAQVSVVLKNLMLKLGIERFYAQGGDWGAMIISSIAALYPQHVIGAHSNMCVSDGFLARLLYLAGSFWPSLIADKEHHSKLYPISKHLSYLLEESGYLHIQATKPDTVGTALADSPVGLATYILEKFSTWTNPGYRLHEDGGLDKKYHLDELLDNVMVYWVSNSITTSVRIYAENFASAQRSLQIDSLPVEVPSGCSAYEYELIYRPEVIHRLRYRKLIHTAHLPQGGHFAAFEEPQLFAKDFHEFVAKAEALLAEEKAKAKRDEEEAKAAKKKKSSP